MQLRSEVAQIPAQISNLEVHQPQGQPDAESEGRELPLSIQCYVMKESCAPSSGNRSPKGLPMQGVLPSEVAQIPAQISNLEVHQPQGRPDAESEGHELPLSIQCYAMKESCAPSSGNRSPKGLLMQGVLTSEVAQIPAQISNLEVHRPQGRHDAESEGRELPLSIQCYAMKESCAPSSANPRLGWLWTPYLALQHVSIQLLLE